MSHAFTTGKGSPRSLARSTQRPLSQALTVRFSAAMGGSSVTGFGHKLPVWEPPRVITKSGLICANGAVDYGDRYLYVLGNRRVAMRMCAVRTPQRAAYREATDTWINARACCSVRTRADSVGRDATVGNRAHRYRTLSRHPRRASRGSRPTATGEAPADR